MLLERTGIDLRWPRRAATSLALAGLFAVTGCIADGPGGSPLGVAFAGKEDASNDASGAKADDGEAKVAVATAGVTKSDRVIARREAAQMAESGTVSGSAAIDKMIIRHAKENGIPPALAFAVVRVESRYNPRARGSGVYGLSQIKPATARSLGFSGPASALLDADTNLTYGMRYLKGAWEKSGHDVCGTAMKYKGGHRANRMTASARSYCSKVKAHMAELDLSRSAPARAVPATVETTRVASRDDAGGLARATAFASEARKPDAAATIAERSAPVEAVPRTISVATGHATEPGASTERSGRVATAAKPDAASGAQSEAERQREANLAARFGDEDGAPSEATSATAGSVPVPALRPSLTD